MKHPLGAVLAVLSDRLLCDFGEVYAILNDMTGDDLFTHQLSRAAGVCQPVLADRFPDLAAIEVPRFDDPAMYAPWVASQAAVHGAEVDVEPLPDGAWEHKDALAELVEMRGGTDGIVVVEA